jgi:hypothetical protein
MPPLAMPPEPAMPPAPASPPVLDELPLDELVLDELELVAEFGTGFGSSEQAKAKIAGASSTGDRRNGECISSLRA